jgi:predicted dienelactone hydrolase
MKLSKMFLAAMLSVAAIGAALQRPAAADDPVGVRQISAWSRERGAALDVTVWYPAAPGGSPVTLGESPFFVGTPALRDAPLADGRFPVILLSHGAGIGGNAAALSWIATPLAEHGYIVAAPNHPGNSGPDRSARETMKLWLRPADLSASLDALGASGLFAPHLEPGKVGVLGLSAGGSTALAIAGARFDAQRLAAYCDTDALNPSLCGWVRQSGVDLHAMDMRGAGRDNRDPRVGFAMAIDPAPVDVFDPGSFAGIAIPMALVNLGRPGEIPVTLQAAGIAAEIPQASYATVADARHFSMFALCKPGAAELAEAEQIGDPICADGGGRGRAALHAALIDMATAAFDRALQQAR